jgi:hypothetical protein
VADVLGAAGHAGRLLFVRRDRAAQRADPLRAAQPDHDRDHLQRGLRHASAAGAPAQESFAATAQVDLDGLSKAVDDAYGGFRERQAADREFAGTHVAGAGQAQPPAGRAAGRQAAGDGPAERQQRPSCASSTASWRRPATSCCSRTRWRRSASWPPAWRTRSTTRSATSIPTSAPCKATWRQLFEMLRAYEDAETAPSQAAEVPSRLSELRHAISTSAYLRTDIPQLMAESQARGWSGCAASCRT